MILAVTVVLVIAVVVLFQRRDPGDGPSATGGSPAAQPGAMVWSTSADGTDRLHAVQQRGTPLPGAERSKVEETATGQPVIGFGAALTHSSAHLLAAMSAERRRELLVELFDPYGPVRLSVLRIPLGGSDFVPEAPYTYDDVAPGTADWELRQFSTAPDERTLRPILREIRAIAPDITIVASPWSPPAWLKTSGTLEGGRLLDDERAFATYAAYLVRVMQEYRAAGIPIDALTLQNEPQARHPDGYPGTDMPVADQVRLMNMLGPALTEAGIDTDVLAFDHNWALHPADAASTPEGADPEPDYAERVLASEAGSMFAGVAFHCYYGDASAQDAIYERFPDKQIWVTECSGSHGPEDTDQEIFAATLTWQAQNLLIASLRHSAQAVLTWNLVLDPAGGPHIGGCSTCTGVVTVDGDEVTRNAEYYVLAHAARFIPPGSVRLESSSTDAEAVAFHTPDGSLALLAYNAAQSERDMEVRFRNEAHRVQIPARALSTVTIGEDVLATGPAPKPWRELNLANAAASADPDGPRDVCCTDDRPERAIDGDATTRWSTGRSQRSGDFLLLDLGQTVAVGTVVLDAGDTGDWPRSYEAQVSPDGESWDGVAVRRTGAGSISAVDLGDERGRFVRIRLTGEADLWWSVVDVHVFTSSGA